MEVNHHLKNQLGIVSIEQFFCSGPIQCRTEEFKDCLYARILYVHSGANALQVLEISFLNSLPTL